jgi:hypothetical protein
MTDGREESGSDELRDVVFGPFDLQFWACEYFITH